VRPSEHPGFSQWPAKSLLSLHKDDPRLHDLAPDLLAWAAAAEDETEVEAEVELVTRKDREQYPMSPSHVGVLCLILGQLEVAYWSINVAVNEAIVGAIDSQPCFLTQPLAVPHCCCHCRQWLACPFLVHNPLLLHSDPTPTFSSSSSYTYSVPDTWDMPPPSPTVVSEFPNIVPAHPLDILPRVALEPFSLKSLVQSWPYDSHHFTEFRPYCTDTDARKLRLTAHPHVTYMHALEHETFCFECVCPTHYPYGGNK
jgi:hypothetical protein